ncbi:MAG: hypothetical protein ABW219_02520 [Ilumatobacteraceae bacterium]
MSTTPEVLADQVVRIEVARLEIEGDHELTIHADDLHPGDVIDYRGDLHLVTRVDRGAGWSWPVAADDDGWAMALGHDLIVLHRRDR